MAGTLPAHLNPDTPVIQASVTATGRTVVLSLVHWALMQWNHGETSHPEPADPGQVEQRREPGGSLGLDKGT